MKSHLSSGHKEEKNVLDELLGAGEDDDLDMATEPLVVNEKRTFGQSFFSWTVFSLSVCFFFPLLFPRQVN